MGPSLTTTLPLTHQTGGGVEKSPFEIAAKSATPDCAHHASLSEKFFNRVRRYSFKRLIATTADSSNAHRNIHVVRDLILISFVNR